MKHYLYLQLLASFCLAGCFGNSADSSNETLYAEQVSTKGSSGSTPPGAVVGATYDPNDGTIVYPFYAVSTQAAVNKVKMLATGFAATEAEVTQGSTQSGLYSLIDAWMKTPQYNQVLLSFFGLAFQQSKVTGEQMNEQWPYRPQLNGDIDQMFRESFARTALYIVQNNQPFTQTATTRQFMMTVPLMMAYGIIDVMDTTDSGQFTDYLSKQDPGLTLKLTNAGPVDINKTVNPSDPSYLTFYCPSLPSTSTGGGSDTLQACQMNNPTLSMSNQTDFLYTISSNIFGTMYNGASSIYYRLKQGGGNTYCLFEGCHKSTTIPSDYDWRLVTIRTPKEGEKATRFFDLPLLRKADTIALRIPRVGFYTTPAFLGQWNTNINNQARSVANQTLITGLGKAFDGSDQTMPQDVRALAPSHAVPGSACYGCHLTMDPIRQYFRQAYTVSYHLQQDTTQTNLPGSWAQNGIVASGGGIEAIGQQIASSPRFAIAWAAKVCSYFNSVVCLESDPYLISIANAFVADNYNFSNLVKNVLASPLTTNLEVTKTSSKRGTVVSIARRDQLCQVLSARLDVVDPCKFNQSVNPPGYFSQSSAILLGYPADSYSRNSAAPAQVTGPTVASRMGLENVCSLISLQMVDNGSNGRFESSKNAHDIPTLVTRLMGLYGSAAAQATTTLTSHYNDAVSAGLSQSDALRSTFVIACLSPSVAMIGL